MGLHKTAAESLEQLALVGFPPNTQYLGSILKDSFRSQANPKEYAQSIPTLYGAWSHQDNEQGVLQWSLASAERAAWTIEYHPRINEWTIVEEIQRCFTQEHARLYISSLADQSPRGALIKAWYGIALSAEEIGRHPLAQSLYVYKHAPEYLEEVKPLPESWSMALSLAATGGQFAEMLLIAAKNKIQPTVQEAAIELPELGGTNHGIS